MSIWSNTDGSAHMMFKYNEKNAGHLQWIGKADINASVANIREFLLSITYYKQSGVIVTYGVVVIGKLDRDGRDEPERRRDGLTAWVVTHSPLDIL